MANTIDWTTASAFTQKVCLAEIDRVLRLAGDRGGAVFGDFVHGVVLPRELDPEAPIHFKQIELWFYGTDAAEEFVAAVGTGLLLRRTYDVGVLAGIPVPEVKGYQLLLHGTEIARLKVWVAAYHPMCNLAINNLIATYTSEAPEPVFGDPRWGMEGSIQILKTMSRARRSDILRGLLPTLADPKVARHQIKRCVQFLKGGGTVHLNLCAYTGPAQAEPLVAWLLSLTSKPASNSQSESVSTIAKPPALQPGSAPTPAPDDLLQNLSTQLDALQSQIALVRAAIANNK